MTVDWSIPIPVREIMVTFSAMPTTTISFVADDFDLSAYKHLDQLVLDYHGLELKMAGVHVIEGGNDEQGYWTKIEVYKVVINNKIAIKLIKELGKLFEQEEI